MSKLFREASSPSSCLWDCAPLMFYVIIFSDAGFLHLTSINGDENATSLFCLLVAVTLRVSVFLVFVASWELIVSIYGSTLTVRTTHVVKSYILFSVYGTFTKYKESSLLCPLCMCIEHTSLTSMHWVFKSSAISGIRTCLFVGNFMQFLV